MLYIFEFKCKFVQQLIALLLCLGAAETLIHL